MPQLNLYLAIFIILLEIVIFLALYKYFKEQENIPPKITGGDESGTTETSKKQ